MRFLRCAFLMLFAASTAPPSAAQSAERPDTPAQLRELRDEIARLREEIAALRKEVRATHGPAAPHLREARAAAPLAVTAAASGAAAAPAPPVPQEPQEPSLAAKVEMLQAQVAEQAQTKVESESRFPVKIFGSIVSSTFFNSGMVDWVDIPTVVTTTTAAARSQGSFASSMRQTRIGAIVEGPVLGGMRSVAVVAVDFLGTIPQFRNGPVLGTPRLLYAYARLEGERTAVLIGQDHMIFAPQNPTTAASMSFPGLYRSGNLYVRYPQIRVERSLATGKQGTLSLALGILSPLGSPGSTGAGDFVHSVSSAERSKHPNFQGRLVWSGRGTAGKRLELGMSGHFGRLKKEVPLPPVSQLAFVADQSWGAAIDFDARVGRFGLGGEGFVGKNLGPMGGALGDFERHSRGGFIEGRIQATERLDFHIGFGTDRLYNHPANLKSNSSLFGNFIYRLTPEFSTSLEYRWLQTARVNDHPVSNNHMNLVFVYRF
jgi:hypothetical protein